MTAVIIVIVVVVVLAIAVAAYLMSKRRTEQRRHRADELRTKADAQLGAVDTSQQEAAAAEARAAVARAEAERAEQQATEAKRGLQFDEARREDALREADAVDPDVDHRSDDYRPGAAGGRDA
jgi:ABC-type Na+ efflux pump permease subunit